MVLARDERLTSIKCAEQSLAHSKCYVSISSTITDSYIRALSVFVFSYALVWRKLHSLQFAQKAGVWEKLGASRLVENVLPEHTILWLGVGRTRQPHRVAVTTLALESHTACYQSSLHPC